MKPLIEDTIAAVSTPPGRGGIGILRLSGRESLPVARQMFRPRKPPLSSDSSWIPAPRRVYLGTIHSLRDGRILDQACLTYFPAPNSYTREDIVELSCHGGLRLMDLVLDQALAGGARLAEPGEFTLRAYLGGRIDITQAEAIQDLIEAESEKEVEIASAQLQGSLLEMVNSLRDGLLDLVAEAEARVEFVDEEEHFPSRRQLIDSFSRLEDRVREAAATYRNGRRIREGFTVAILGLPNVGKSTLFNSLVGSSRAIVTADPGTTRDVISEMLEMEGIRVRLLDTAGLRQAENDAEAEGIQRARQVATDAELILFVFDLNRPVSTEEVRTVESIGPEKVVPVWNKSDLGPDRTIPAGEFPGGAGPSFRLSALKGEGIERLRKEIVSRAGTGPGTGNGKVVISRLRHQRLLEEAAGHLSRCAESARKGASEEYLLIDLHGALRSLGGSIGEVEMDDVYESIFSRFCIGK